MEETDRVVDLPAAIFVHIFDLWLVRLFRRKKEHLLILLDKDGKN